MSDRTDAIVQALFNKPSLQECSRQQVDSLAQRHPYFCTAQLLLLQKTEREGEAQAAQLQRAALYFSNPLQLAYWLHPDVFETEMPETELFQKPMPEAESAGAVESEAPEQEDAVEASNENSAEPSTEQPAVFSPEQTPAAQPIAEVAETTAPEKTASPEKPAILFEPYHTVDYFASQGIKLSQQEATNDTLGRQLKSFTEWLKTMKRLPDVTATPVDAAGERNVEHLAAHSLNTPDVVTESMAEVWLKQGEIRKAVDVYNKLSLRDPSKSAYFAAKIEAIKQ
jgi:hypothetical protein